MKYKVVIYDIDNTLMNTLRMNMIPLMKIIKEEKGIDYTYEEVLKFAPYPGMKVMEELEIENPDEVYQRWVKYVNAFEEGATSFDGVDELLEVMSHKIMQAVVSAKKLEQYVIDFSCYDHYMETHVLEEDTKKHKPDPEPLNKCLERLGLSASEALYVGDAPSDLQASLNAGMDFAFAKWGSVTPVNESMCTYVLQHPLDLLKVVE